MGITEKQFELGRKILKENSCYGFHCDNHEGVVCPFYLEDDEFECKVTDNDASGFRKHIRKKLKKRLNKLSRPWKLKEILND